MKKRTVWFTSPDPKSWLINQITLIDTLDLLLCFIWIEKDIINILCFYVLINYNN